jgi:hypothetical protein
MQTVYRLIKKSTLRDTHGWAMSTVDEAIRMREKWGMHDHAVVEFGPPDFSDPRDRVRYSGPPCRRVVA